MGGRDNLPPRPWVHVADPHGRSRHSGRMTQRHLIPTGKRMRPSEPQDVDQFLARYGDTIDDRVAEIVDDVFEERLGRHHRLPVLPLIITVVAATVVSLLLMWYSPLTAAVVWAAAAVICVSLTHAARASKHRR